MEVWKDIPGYEKMYQVSNLGRVKSLSRYVNHNYGGKRLIKEKIKEQTINRQGYYCVGLCNVKTRQINVHQLVALCFLGHKEKGFKNQVDHIDNDRLNNNLKNLQIITSRENASKDRKSNCNATGVYYIKERNVYTSHIRINGKKKHLGTFETKKAASLEYKKALENIV